MLKIDDEFRRGILFIRLSGKFTVRESNYFHEMVINKIKENGIRSIVFNIYGLDEIDLKGIHDFYYAYELCNSNLGKVLLCEVHSPCFLKLKKHRLFKYIDVISSELDAFETIKI